MFCGIIMKIEKYTDPECIVIDAVTMEILCASPSGNIEDLSEENVEW